VIARAFIVSRVILPVNPLAKITETSGRLSRIRATR